MILHNYACSAKLSGTQRVVHLCKCNVVMGLALKMDFGNVILESETFALTGLRILKFVCWTIVLDNTQIYTQ